jgi:hypothetical protein
MELVVFDIENGNEILDFPQQMRMLKECKTNILRPLMGL